MVGTWVGVDADGITVAEEVGGALLAVSVLEPPEHETVNSSVTVRKPI